MLTTSLLAFLNAFGLAAVAARTPDVLPRAGLDSAVETTQVDTLSLGAFPQNEDEDTDGWDGALNAMSVVSNGNTDVKNVHVTLDALKRWDIHRITVLAGYHNERAFDTTTMNNLTAQAKYDHFLDHRSYVYGESSWRKDSIADLQTRFTLGGGYGYQWIDEANLQVNTEAGLSWIYEDLDGLRPDDWFAARLAWNILWIMDEMWSFGHVGAVYPSLEDSDDVYGQATSFARANLNENLFAQLTWIFTYDNTPAIGADREDHLYTLTVGWTF